MGKKLKQGEGWKLITEDDGAPPSGVESLPPDRQRIRLSLEKRRKGKVVTVISGLVLDPADLKALARSLKSACGTGGTIQDGLLELQGDCRPAATDWLRANGWNVR